MKKNKRERESLPEKDTMSKKHVTFSSRKDICIPQPDDREQATETHITDEDVMRAEEETGLHAFRPSRAPLQSGSLQATHRDVHGIYDAFVGGDTQKLDLSRPPYAKKPSNEVLREMVDWERVKAEQLDQLRADPVYRFLADLATHARVDIQEFLQDKIGTLKVGREFVERQEQARVGITPEPQEPRRRLQRATTMPLPGDVRRERRRRRREEEEGSGSVVSSASVRRKRRKAVAMKQDRADFPRAQRIEAFDARTWLQRVEVIGQFAISDRAITTINYNYTRIIANVASLNGVHVKYFMSSEHVKQLFAQLCGLYLNYLDFTSRRTFIEISMNPVYLGSMDNIIRTFSSSVVWNDRIKELQLNPARRTKPQNCQLTVYTRIDGGCQGTAGLALCNTGGITLPLYPC